MALDAFALLNQGAIRRFSSRPRPRPRGVMGAPAAGQRRPRDPGRVRLRVARLDEDRALGAALDATLRRLPGVSAVRVATGAASVVVEHDPAAIDVAAITGPPPAPADAAPLARRRRARRGRRVPRRSTGRARGCSSRCRSGQGSRSWPTPSSSATAVPVFARAWDAAGRRRKLNVDLLDALAILAATATGDVINATGSSGSSASATTSAISPRPALAARSAISRVRARARLGRPRRHQGPASPSPTRGGRRRRRLHRLDIAVDGVVEQGRAVVDQQALTGESLPVVKTVDDPSSRPPW